MSFLLSLVFWGMALLFDVDHSHHVGFTVITPCDLGRATLPQGLGTNWFDLQFSAPSYKVCAVPLYYSVPATNFLASPRQSGVAQQ